MINSFNCRNVLADGCCNAVISMSRTILSCLTDALVFLSSAVTPLSSVLNAVAFDEALIFINWSRTALSSVTSALFFLSSTAAPWSSTFHVVLVESPFCPTIIILSVVSAPSQFPDASAGTIVLEGYDIHLA